VKPQLRRALWPLLAALPVLAVLLALGTWQMRRLAWKEGVLQRLGAAEAAAPLPLADAAPGAWTRVTVSGRFDYDHEALLGAEVRNGTLGATLVTPLLRHGAPPLLVLRGWVPLARNQTIDRPEGEQQLVGYVRAGETPGWMAARDNPPQRLFYTFNPAAIAEALHLPAVAPFGLVVLGTAGSRLPIVATTLPRPDNPHLGYALTWYGLALTLVGVALAFARKRWQEGR
jgi:surfeit locus 1 family protein